MTRRLNAGMVGGGRDAFIGGVHRMAMRLDGKIELVAGAFSSNPEKAKLSGEDLLLDAQRVYADYRTMAAEESRLPSGERIDFVSVVTPNRIRPYPTGRLSWDDTSQALRARLRSHRPSGTSSCSV